MKPTRIIIFAKAPRPGLAKTRLIPALGAEGAAALAQQMLMHTLQEALAANAGTVELSVTPSLDAAVWNEIQLPAGIEISAQGEGDLGARMARAATRAVDKGEAVLLIGTDCVEMSADLLHEAWQVLHDHDAIIHCTSDGGYALLGLKQISPFLFSDMPWSTDAVASTTIARFGQLGWSVHVGQMLHDVDEPQDLKYVSEQWRSHVVA
jgi:rSAM/selenodomain-associated transferase 1